MSPGIWHGSRGGSSSQLPLPPQAGSARTSRGVGAELRRGAMSDRRLAVEDERRADAWNRTAFHGRSARSRRMPRAITCGSAKTSATVLIGPAGTPSFSSAERSASRVNFDAERADDRDQARRDASRGRRCARSADRSRAPARRALSTKRANCGSLPTATIMWPSETGST